MKILSAVCLAIMFLITSPFFILFYGSIEFFKLYKDTLKLVSDRLDKKED